MAARNADGGDDHQKPRSATPLLVPHLLPPGPFALGLLWLHCCRLSPHSSVRLLAGTGEQRGCHGCPADASVQPVNSGLSIRRCAAKTHRRRRRRDVSLPLPTKPVTHRSVTQVTVPRSARCVFAARNSSPSHQPRTRHQRAPAPARARAIADGASRPAATRHEARSAGRRHPDASTCIGITRSRSQPRLAGRAINCEHDEVGGDGPYRNHGALPARAHGESTKQSSDDPRYAHRNHRRQRHAEPTASAERQRDRGEWTAAASPAGRGRVAPRCEYRVRRRMPGDGIISSPCASSPYFAADAGTNDS